MPLADVPRFSTIGSPPLTQTAFLELAVDTTTTSTSFVDLLTINATTFGGLCLVTFSASGSNATTNTNVYFTFSIDGVFVRGTKFRQDTGSGAPASLVCEVAPAAGSRVFKVQWAVSAGTGRIRAGTVTEEHASLLIEEISR